MAALDRVSVAGLPGITKEVVQRLAREAIWKWFEEHKDEVIFEKKIFFLSIKLRIRDLGFLIERIAGGRAFTV